MFPYKANTELNVMITSEKTTDVTVAYTYPGVNPANSLVKKGTPASVNFAKWNLNGKVTNRLYELMFESHWSELDLCKGEFRS